MKNFKEFAQIQESRKPNVKQLSKKTYKLKSDMEKLFDELVDYDDYTTIEEDSNLPEIPSRAMKQYEKSMKDMLNTLDEMNKVL